MAKVKIQGHASGTGVLTVTAPNTSTDRTITLPDSTDTLAVNSDVTNKLPLAGGTMTGDIEIDAGNKTRIVIGDNGNDLSTVDLCRSDTSIGSGNDLGAVTFSGEDNTGNVRTAHAMILGESDGTHSAGDNPTRISFWTTPAGSSTMTERMRILSSGGITFNGDTAAANALDDYEEGTWTPNVGGNATYSSQLGHYTKVGNMITAKCTLQINAINSSARNQIQGLPYTSTSGSATPASVGYYVGLAASPTWIGCYVDANNTSVTFIWNTGNSASIGANGQNVFQNSARIDICVNYQTT